MFLLQLAIVILACHACGSVAVRIGQCRVVGEIVAGILLGPTVLGVAFPALHRFVLPASVSASLSQLGELGVVLLMFEIGLHIRLPGPAKLASARLPALVAALGLAVPLVLGMGVAAWSRATLAPNVPALSYVLFCGVALGVSAVPVMVRIVADLGLSNHPMARTALAAAMMTDVAGWILLAVVASIAGAEHGNDRLLISLLGPVVYIAGCVAAVRVAIQPLLSKLAARDDLPAMFAIVVCTVLVSSCATASLGLHSAFGALLPGMLLRDVPALREHWDRWFGGFLRTVLMPVFFSYAGLHMSMPTVTGNGEWWWFVVFLAAGFIGKFGGSYGAARLCGLLPGDAALVGSLMNARGLMELIVLSIGLQLRILPAAVYTMLVLFALVTTAATTPLVRYQLRSAERALPDAQSQT